MWWRSRRSRCWTEHGDAPITVPSGFRSYACDNAVGGSSTIRHLYGDAADLTGSPAPVPPRPTVPHPRLLAHPGPVHPGHNDHTHRAFAPSPYWSAPTCGSWPTGHRTRGGPIPRGANSPLYRQS
ncbi:D-Ala-D-Ala carboxypeptidase family metallohydrolase [Streptomyces sp. TRM68416]|uniref:D-Ala-D-Ala carboxypeptidase family metallohydrolase n=1 Tax=Streptomyces sp. TRM68416 TaxID=2758412 RepID=UPI002948C2C2|nr:D-Ala-D-Ala carboxypeptidase family metallohydrolase [Streptomyces sp. TRM68416]